MPGRPRRSSACGFVRETLLSALFPPDCPPGNRVRISRFDWKRLDRSVSLDLLRGRWFFWRVVLGNFFRFCFFSFSFSFFFKLLKMFFELGVGWSKLANWENFFFWSENVMIGEIWDSYSRCFSRYFFNSNNYIYGLLCTINPLFDYKCNTSLNYFIVYPFVMWFLL